MPAMLEHLAELVRGRLVGDGDIPIRAARPVSEAGPGDITFVEGEKYAKLLRRSEAAAVIAGPHFRWGDGDLAKPTIHVEDPLTAFIAVVSHLKGGDSRAWSGVHPLAWVSPTAKIGEGAAIHPFAYVGDGVEIGEGTTILPHAVIREHSKIGRDCTIHPHAVLYPEILVGDRVTIHAGTVVGGDGFGYRLHEGRHIKVPQTGIVTIADDVEIGANATIDRGTFEATVIGEGTKIDNLVMIGHNNRIGRHNLLCGQVGLAGSCITGDYVVMAGQAGIKDHVNIGDRALIGAQAGVHRDVPEDAQMLGAPAIPIKEQRVIMASMLRLPMMRKQLQEITALVSGLTKRNMPDDDPTGF